MYDITKFKRLSYLSMYTSFNNMAFKQNKGIVGFMFGGECHLHEGGSSLCKDCKYSLKVEIPFGSICIYQYLCIYCINRLYNTRSILDDLFTGKINSRYETFKKVLKRCGIV